MSESSLHKRKGERGALSISACNSGKELALRIIQALNKNIEEREAGERC